MNPGAEAPADGDADAGTGSGVDAVTETGADARTESGADARTETVPTAPGASKAPGDGPGGDGPDASSDDDFLATLTDLFADDRRAPAADLPRELDEVALRRMLHGAVRDISPSEGTSTISTAPSPPAGPGGGRPSSGRPRRPC